MLSCKATEQITELLELDRTLREWLWPSTLAPASRKLGPQVGCDAVDDDQADVVALNHDGNLVTQDVFLRFEVVDVRAVDPVQRWSILGLKCGD